VSSPADCDEDCSRGKLYNVDVEIFRDGEYTRYDRPCWRAAIFTLRVIVINVGVTLAQITYYHS